MNRTTARHLRDAMIMGRVQRLLGHKLSVNPYPERSKRWLAFHEGWHQTLYDPICKIPKTPGNPATITGEGGNVMKLRR